MRRTTTWRRLAMGGLVLALITAACGAGDTGDRDSGDGDAASTSRSPAETDGSATSTQPDRTDRDSPTSLPEKVPSDDGGSTVTGEVPVEYLTPVIEDAAARAGVEPSTVSVVTAQEMIWPDGSLGCAEPGGIYTQAEVPGYWVIVEAGGAAYDYRLTGNGTFKYCESPFGVPGGTAPTS